MYISQNLEKQIEAMKPRLTEAENKVDAITKERDSLNREVKLLRESAKQFAIKSEDNESTRQEIDALRRELEHLKTSAHYDGEERQQHVDKIRSHELYISQLELDNRELANKVRTD